MKIWVLSGCQYLSGERNSPDLDHFSLLPLSAPCLSTRCRAAELQSCEASDIWGWVIKARKWSPCRPQIHQRGAGMILNPAHSSETLRNTQKHSETRLLFDIEPTQTSLTPILQNKLDQRTGGDQWVARDHSWKPLWWWRAAESRCYKDFDWAESRQNICWQSW